jgi:NADPH-dependent glutamate synthase beta subunit-like oxidoreductase
MGYGATVFEALPVAGGMLTVGIPEYRLPGAWSEDDAFAQAGVECT